MASNWASLSVVIQGSDNQSLSAFSHASRQGFKGERLLRLELVRASGVPVQSRYILPRRTMYHP